MRADGMVFAALRAKRAAGKRNGPEKNVVAALVAPFRDHGVHVNLRRFPKVKTGF
jgi:hypothetical protein